MLNKYLIQDQVVGDATKFVGCIASMSPDDEVAFFESDIHRKWLLPKTSIQCVKDHKTVLITERRYRWLLPNGKMVHSPAQAFPYCIWTGPTEHLINGIFSLNDETENALEALILFVNLHRLTWDVADAFLTLMLDYNACPILREERMKLAPMIHLARHTTPEQRANEPKLTFI